MKTIGVMMKMTMVVDLYDWMVSKLHSVHWYSMVSQVLVSWTLVVSNRESDDVVMTVSQSGRVK